MDDETLIFRKGFPERVSHIDIRGVVTVDNADNVLDGCFLGLKTLKTLSWIKEVSEEADR